ncbi:MAG: hypothetical protein JWP91_2854 [Fibrobacteres bacterium]|nr:hypothetical protein [Fibrobacterota bacterium]
MAQLGIFREGQKFTRLERACTLNDGIVRLSPPEMESLSASYAAARESGRAMEFIPASGAATRMFKGLVAVRLRADRPAFAVLAKEASQNADAKETVDWFNGLRGFAFFGELSRLVSRNGKDAEELYAAKEYRPFLEAMLSPEGLHYADRPKALIPFHRYPDGSRTSLEEHLAEAAGLVRDREGICRLHFTVSPDHERDIHAMLDTVRGKYEAAGAQFEIGLSQQRPSTDTLAADQENAPQRNADNSLCLRPGGHGALLENLFHTGGDIVFIKNIDNVAHERLRPEVLANRNALGGYLVRMQERIFAYLGRLRDMPDANLIEEAAHFAEHRLGAVPPDSMREPATDSMALAAKAAFVIKTLDRPLRVCAMVKNEGEPGGGPFWVRAKDGTMRPQIVESAQVDMGSSQQRKIVESATHFNPVDMVCGLRDGKGELYKLQDFVDTEAYFITIKAKDGKTMKALELPGLWNGSMAFWNTVFVEVPVGTFNPVKTVNDLLRPNHQAGAPV